jgi:phenylpropionate dioxygenase-like ring-hydroxylating dioxygenase large terminal subunit
MREYWIPALRADEIAADGPPVRLALLGERLLAFRDSQGRPGILEHACPHRGASLFFGRNEHGGIRCVYHGWKFDVTGRAVDIPNVKNGRELCGRIGARAYPAREAAGIVWVYMGRRATPPDLPALPVLGMPEGDITVQFVQRECNWLQAAEGDIDTSHFGFLHAGSVDASTLPQDHQSRFAVADRVPQYHVSDTECGVMYAAHRPATEGSTYWRFAHFLFPFWTMPPDGDMRRRHLARGWVPMDDSHTMAVIVRWKKNAPALRELADGTRIPGTTAEFRYAPSSTGWFGRWRLAGNEGNDYLIDREMQKHGSFTGIDGVFLQDHAITESMGPIVDHAREHLVASDSMIVQTRRRILNALDAHAAGGGAPAVDAPQAYAQPRCGDCLAPEAASWKEAYAAHAGGEAAAFPAA